MLTIVDSDSNLKINQVQPVSQEQRPVIVKIGKVGLRFGPVVTGHVALGKDGCGY